MGIAELIILSLGLAMDAFAVSVGKGLAVGKIKIKHVLAAGLWFGGFQAFMPLLGYLLGSSVRKYIEAYDHWIAFALLAFIGINMIREALAKNEDYSPSMKFKEMLVLAVATSIDALTAGISIAVTGADIVLSCIFIGVITFILSCAGIYFGSRFGRKFRKQAGIAGGVILILIGLKILLNHLGVIGF